MFEFFNKNCLSQDLLNLIFDRYLHSKYSSLISYFEDESIDFDDSEYHRFIEHLEAEQVKQIRYLSLLQFYGMSKTGQWGYGREDAIRTSMICNVLQLSTDVSLSHDHLFEFSNKIEELYKDYGINDLTGKDALYRFKNTNLKLLGREQTLTSVNYSKLLHFCGSTLSVTFGQFQENGYYLLGESDYFTKERYDIFIFKKELVRTPNLIMACAALNTDNVIELRMESLRTIFHQKWSQVFSDDYFYQSRVQADPMWGISHFIKERALSLYGANSSEDLERISNMLINDVRETVLFHEIGHGIMNNDILESKVIGILQSTRAIGTETIYNTMWEFFADFAPKTNQLYGPIYNIVKQSISNKKRAEALFWTYFSDIWFYDTDDSYMESYSDVMVLILLKYINKDLSINFDKLLGDLDYSLKFNPKNKNLSLYQRILEMSTWDSIEIETILKETVYDMPKDVSFSYLSQLVYSGTKNDLVNDEDDSVRFQSMYWNWIMNCYFSHAKDSERLRSYIKNQEVKILKKFFIISAGRRRAEDYHFDHRKYIVDRCTALGMIPKKEY